MPSSNSVDQIIFDLIDHRGVTRTIVAERLGLKPAMVSMLKKGKSSIDDSRMEALAQLHGGLSARDLLMQKYLDWLASEKHITEDELLAYLTQQRQAHKKHRA